MRTTTKFLVGLLSAFALSSEAVADRQTYSCEGSKDRIRHVFSLTLVDGRYDSFSYWSGTREGDTCDIGAGHHPNAEVPDEKYAWRVISADEAEVTISNLEGKYAEVSLKKHGQGYKLQLKSRALNSCGLHGYIEGAVMVLPHNKKCRFPKPEGYGTVILPSLQVPPFF